MAKKQILEKMKLKLIGTKPLLLNNANAFLDPFNPDNKHLKSLTKKKNRSEDEEREIQTQHFLMSMYLDKDEDPIIPAENIESMLIEAARKSKKGKQFQSGVWAEDAKIGYKGPKDIFKLLEQDEFRDVRSVRVQRSRVLRTRPKFEKWTAEIVLTYDPEQVTPDEIRNAAEVGGMQVGICDYRPKHGLFTVEDVK